jgi:LuxR family transcriptional regulator, maltose regulon positive regulatory protein
MGELE